MENNFVTYYTFIQQTPPDRGEIGGFPLQTSSQKSITMSDETAWPAIVREFTNFLSGIYGYDISAKVFVQDVNWETGEAEYSSIQDYT
jgi:hypothetical protein